MFNQKFNGSIHVETLKRTVAFGLMFFNAFARAGIQGTASMGRTPIMNVGNTTINSSSFRPNI